jgi:hypothetical protein
MSSVTQVGSGGSSISAAAIHEHDAKSAAAAPFNEEESDKLAKSGVLIYHRSIDQLGEPTIWVTKRVNTSGKPGFGLASTRLIVKESLKIGGEGRFYNEASWTSHFFHLFMGMIPVDREISEVSLMWPALEINHTSEDNEPECRFLANFVHLKEKITSKQDLTHDDQNHLNQFKDILVTIKGVSKKEITDKMFAESEADLKAFQGRQVSYVQAKFIPYMLRKFRWSIRNQQRADTNGYGSVCMVLSDVGIERWKAAIDGKKPFKQFKDLEQLRPMMTAEQLKELDGILTERESIKKLDLIRTAYLQQQLPKWLAQQQLQ